MTARSLALVLLSVASLVAGQVLLKVGMQPAQPSVATDRRGAALAAGVGAMTVWFMAWLGLMQEMDLSRLFPFEGLATVLLSLAASVILRERTTPRIWVAIGVIAGGVALVGAS